MNKEIKLKCSKKYENNLKNTFKHVEITNEEKTIIVNNDLVCDFNPSLYVEQRILRCLKKHNQKILSSDKIKLMISLNTKTKRFLIDCEQSLFEDFYDLSKNNSSLENFHEQNSRIFEKSYNDMMFEAELFCDMQQLKNIAMIKISQTMLNQFDKTWQDIVDILKNFYNVLEINYFVVEIKNEINKNILIYSEEINLCGFCLVGQKNILISKDSSVWTVDSKYKFNKIANELKEYNRFD